MLESAPDPRNSRVLKTGLLAIVGIGFAVALLQLTCRPPADVERIIEASPGLISHDQFCRGIPLPPDFELESRSLGGNSFTTAIGYTFRSRTYFAQVRDFFVERLVPDGWTSTGVWEGNTAQGTKSISFSKDSYQIRIYLIRAAGTQPAEYSLYCARVSPR